MFCMNATREYTVKYHIDELNEKYAASRTMMAKHTAYIQIAQYQSLV